MQARCMAAAISNQHPSESKLAQAITMSMNLWIHSMGVRDTAQVLFF